MAAGKAKKNTAQKKQNTKSQGKATAEQMSLWQEIVLLVALGFSVLLFLSGIGFGGTLTDSISEGLFGSFGVMAYVFPILFFFSIFFIIAGENIGKMISRVFAGLVIFLALCVLFQIFVKDFAFDPKDPVGFFEKSKVIKKGGGIFGAVTYRLLFGMLGKVGSVVFCVILILLAGVVITRKPILKGLHTTGGRRQSDSAKKDAELRRKRAQLKKEEQFRKKKADLEYRHKERKLQQDAKLQRKKQHLQQLELKNQREEKEAERLRRLRTQQSRDTDFAVTDLRGGVPASKEEKVRTQKIVVPPERKQQTDRQDFTITRGGRSTMIDLEDPQKMISASGNGKGKEQKAGELQKPSAAEEPAAKKTVSKKEAAKAAGEVATQVRERKTVSEKDTFQFPPLDFLQKGVSGTMGDSDEKLRSTAVKLQQTLHSFGVNVTVLDVSCGPAVTRYELQPEVGVKVSRIVGLADDIKLNLAVSDIRIEAPIPGKPAVGIEVPNSEKSPVFLRELLESAELRKNKSVLAFPAGKDISGKVIVADLAKMPHMLVAGTTGSGKSVFTNSVILSMLYRAKPSELRFIIIDPKVVEFGVYNGIPHLMIPVVTDPKKAAGALNWAVAEMSERYKKFADLQVRDLNSYNAKIDSIQNIPLQEGETRPEKMPKIVIIIDELADLMMVAAKEVEDAICRLAQLARAAGIHMIIATQRPSVDVVTGLIKANIPSRVALSVASGIDSRTILDMNGAEKLLGNGDMLFYPSGYPKPIRVQGAFVSDQEVGNIVRFLKEQNQEVVYNKDVEEKMNSIQLSSGTGGTAAGEDERDEYFADAGRFIIEKEKASIGMLQRVFKIGFNRAARIMDQLAEAGVVGEDEGTKPRKILMSMTDFENLLEEIA